MRLVRLDTRCITDWDTFHDFFVEAFGLPDFYGRTMDAWIDCMSWLDDPSAKMSTVHAPPGEVVVLELEHVDDFSQRCPEQYRALVECSAFVNWRKIKLNESAVLALAFSKNP